MHDPGIVAEQEIGLGEQRRHAADLRVKGVERRPLEAGHELLPQRSLFPAPGHVNLCAEFGRQGVGGGRKTLRRPAVAGLAGAGMHRDQGFALLAAEPEQMRLGPGALLGPDADVLAQIPTLDAERPENIQVALALMPLPCQERGVDMIEKIARRPPEEAVLRTDNMAAGGEARDQITGERMADRVKNNREIRFISHQPRHLAQARPGPLAPVFVDRNDLVDIFVVFSHPGGIAPRHRGDAGPGITSAQRLEDRCGEEKITELVVLPDDEDPPHGRVVDRVRRGFRHPQQRVEKRELAVLEKLFKAVPGLHLLIRSRQGSEKGIRAGRPFSPA